MQALTQNSLNAFNANNRARAATEMDVEYARTTSTPDALTVIDPRVSTMGLRGLADGSLIL